MALKNLLDKKQLAEQLGCTTKKVWDLMESGQLPYRKIGRHVRFMEEDVMTLLKNSLVSRGKRRNGVHAAAH